MTLRQRFKFWLYGRCPGYAGAFPYFGVRVHFPRGSQIFEIACAQGIYEQVNLRILASALRPNAAVFDVGANIGLMSVPLLTMEPTVRVVSIEASPAPLASLQKTIAGSGFGGRWQARGVAVSDKSGTVEFSCADPSMSIYDGMRDTQRGGASRTVQVPAMTLDQIWEEQGRPDLCAVKIDVEGAEAAVFQGAQKCLRATRALILIEWNADNLRAYHCPPERLLTLAEELGFTVYALPGMIRTDSAAHLRTQMQLDENFVLLPR